VAMAPALGAGMIAGSNPAVPTNFMNWKNIKSMAEGVHFQMQRWIALLTIAAGLALSIFYLIPFSDVSATALPGNALRAGACTLLSAAAAGAYVFIMKLQAKKKEESGERRE